MPSGISLGGLISGMNTDDMLQKIMEAETKRIKSQDSKKQALEAKQNAWNDIQSSLSTLRSKLDAIRFESTFRARKVTLSNEAAASVTVSSGVTTMTHSLSISKLAQSHAIASQATYTDQSAALGLDGKFTITVGTGAVPDPAPVEITVTATDSLSSIHDAIQSKAGGLVSVDVVKVQDPVGQADRYRLVITSKTSGVKGKLTITSTSATDITKETGGLGFFKDADGSRNETVAAQDAEFTLDNQSYKWSTNTVSGVIPDVTITLKKADAVTPVRTDITIAQDPDKVSSAVQDWLGAWNDTMGLLAKHTAFNPDKNQASVLTGDGLARSLQTTLRGMLSNVVAGQPPDLDALSDVGITSGKYGTPDYGKVLLDATKLSEKLGANEDGVAKLFGALRNNLALPSANPTVSYAASSYDQSDPTKDYSPAGAFNNVFDTARFGSVGGGWQSANVPTPGAPEYLTVNLGSLKNVSRLVLFLPDGADTAGLKNFTLEYSLDSTDGLTNGTWSTITDVKDNVRSYNSFEFQAVQAKWVRLKVTETNGGAKAQVLEMQVHEATSSPGLSMYQFVNSSLQPSNGPVSQRGTGLSDQIKDIDTRMETMLDQLDKREKILRQQFQRMEAAMAGMQNQGSLILRQMQMMSSGK